MQYRHMHDCPKVSRWVPSLNTNGIDWNAGAPKSLRALKTTPTPKIKMPPKYMATRKGMERVMAALSSPVAVLPMVIFFPPRSAAPNLPSDGTTTFHASVAVWCRSVHLTRFIGYAERAYRREGKGPKWQRKSRRSRQGKRPRQRLKTPWKNIFQQRLAPMKENRPATLRPSERPTAVAR